MELFDFKPLFTSFFILEWVIRVVMLFVVPSKQRTSTVHAWLFFIMITPTIGTLFYYMFGNPNLPKSRRETLKVVTRMSKREIASLQKDKPELFTEIANDDYDTIAVLSTHLGGLPPMRGNSVKLLTDYDAVFAHLVQMIDEAKEYIHMQYFIAVYDDKTAPVYDALQRARERGVIVRFMFDRPVSARFHGGFRLKARLVSLGIDVREMLPFSLIPGKRFTRPDLRNHRKLVIIDGRSALCGSQNLIQKSYGRRDGLYYVDLVAQITGPAVWQLNNVFRADWFAETGDALKEIVEDNDMPPMAGAATIQVLPSGPNHEHDNNLKLYTSMVHAAKKRVHIMVPYFIPDSSLLDALTTAAQRGVEVTIINSEVIDKLLAGHAQRSFYDELLAVGVHIYLYKKPAFLHAKQMLIDDDVAIFGSSNLDIRSFELNFELNTIVYDRHVVQELKSLEQQYLKHSKQITATEWANRPFRLKMMDRLASLASTVL